MKPVEALSDLGGRGMVRRSRPPTGDTLPRIDAKINAGPMAVPLPRAVARVVGAG
jgi:hypothetical protein